MVWIEVVIAGGGTTSAFPDDTTLDTVADTMAHLSFADDDGVRHFNRIYTEVTREVVRQLAAGGFEEPRFITVLDVRFAELYLDALRSPATAPRAWRVVFERRHHSLAPLRFALAGMNAHINRDLAVALDVTCTRLGGTLDRDSPRCRDFLKINGILAELMAQAKSELFSRFDKLADIALGPLDDLCETWSITVARDSAWTHGVILHRLGPGPARDDALRSMDRTAALIGRLLLL
ncbi:MAG: hypothetical protein E6J91_51195 [Deltaproteobacteria bacterium]|nr:MAG: hypothetical protein E6J91_51195 [Deltaproteobacteria bacterium]